MFVKRCVERSSRMTIRASHSCDVQQISSRRRFACWHAFSCVAGAVLLTWSLTASTGLAEPTRSVASWISSGDANASVGAWDDAFRDYSAAVVADRSSVEAWFRFATVATIVGDWDTAWRAFERAAELDPENPDIRARRAQLADAIARDDALHVDHVDLFVDDEIRADVARAAAARQDWLPAVRAARVEGMPDLASSEVWLSLLYGDVALARAWASLAPSIEGAARSLHPVGTPREHETRAYLLEITSSDEVVLPPGR